MNVDKLITIAEKQEELLQFPHFNRNDAWELGNVFVKKIQENSYPMTVSIRLSNGLIAFHYAAEGTRPDNESWLTKKFNVVRDMEVSSLLNTLRIIKKKSTLEERGLDPKFYVWGGGGFPIRVKGTGVVGAAAVSGLPGLQDHATLVECIAVYLKTADVPWIPANTKI
jgi:uncharacterized protein (UPF0303 family)